MKRKSIALISLLLFSLIIPNFIINSVKASTINSMIITSNTTWTKTNSPYILMGPVAVAEGVTLTIEAGTTVTLNSYYIRVNGTLTAIGTQNSNINFNGGQITFTEASNSWKEKTNSGCIIENSLINQTSIYSNNAIKIDNCIINSQLTIDSSIISNNIITGNINCQSAIPSPGQNNAPADTSVVSSNNVKGNIIIGSVNLGAVTAPSEACTVFNNTVEGSIISGSPQGTPQIFNNTVSGGGIGCTGYGSIFNNYVQHCETGISLYSIRVFGGYLACFATVENNLIVDNTNGIRIYLASLDGPGTLVPTIQNNTIARNSIGISLNQMNYGATPIIRYNNFQNNSNYNFYLGASNNINATYNWWGTVNAVTINQSIYDFKNDFNLGTTSFVPFLNAPNFDAPLIPEFSSILILPLFMTITLLISLIYFKKHRH